jgi:murein DD-endopeptidase MepM/ murein hydrolase activator NlpD
LSFRQARRLRRATRIALILGLVLLPCGLSWHVEPEAATPSSLARTLASPLDAPLKVLSGTIGRNSTLARSLESYLPPAIVQQLVESARPMYDLARVSVGHPFGLTLQPNGLLSAFTYGIDELQTLRVVRDGERLKADVVRRAYDVKTEYLAGTIESSLFSAIEATGAQDQLAIDLADVFSWDVDFNTEIQRGDSFRVAVEVLSLDGRFVRYGNILAAELVRGERDLKAVYFEGKSGHGYYAPSGQPLRRAFLRSPLKFTRISSRFTHSRFHPILSTFRAHLGVDYAAATGTPVHAAGDGVVAAAGWSGGFGQTVRIHHPNGYETLYGHLSRILVRRGQHVDQGMHIGNVGMTGLATGPHLDYRMSKNGVFMDPLKVVSPQAEPNGEHERARFQEFATQTLARLASETGSARRADARAPGAAAHVRP